MVSLLCSTLKGHPVAGEMLHNNRLCLLFIEPCKFISTIYPMSKVFVKILTSVLLSFILHSNLPFINTVFRKGRVMGDDIDKDMKRLMDELDEDMEFMPMGEAAYPRKRSSGLKSRGKILIIGSVVILALVLLIMLFPRGGNNIPGGELIALKAKLDHLEKRITDTATIKSQIDHLERREEGLQKRTAETVISVDALSKEIEELAKKIDETKTKPVPDATKTTITPASRKQTKPALTLTKPEAPPVSPEQTKQTLGTQRYHVVRSGENLYRISLRYGITLKKLYRINNITVDHVIRPGDKILVNPGTAD